MSNSTKLLYQAFATFLFCIAVSLLVFGYRNFTILMNTSKGVVREKIIYEQNHEMKESIVTKGELMAMLFTPLEYDIEIDGVLLHKYDHVKGNFNSYPILEGDYHKRYVYNNHGNIIKILFTRISNVPVNER